MQIKFNDITQFLNNHGISYTLRGKFLDNYKICSLLFPEEKGFYFLEEGYSDDSIFNSLILAHEDFQAVNNNAVISIKESPQVIYYELLNYYFKDVSTGIICKTAIIDKEAIIGENVQIDSYTVIGKCEIGSNSIIKSHSTVQEGSIIGDNVVVESHNTIGAKGVAWVFNRKGIRIIQPQLGGVIIKSNCLIGAGTVIVRGSLNEDTVIGENTVIAPGAKIGHGCQISQDVHLSNNVTLAGNVNLGRNCFLGSGSIVTSRIKISPNSIVGAGAMVNKNFTTESITLVGVPAKPIENHDTLKGIPSTFRKEKNE